MRRGIVGRASVVDGATTIGGLGPVRRRRAVRALARSVLTGPTAGAERGGPGDGRARLVATAGGRKHGQPPKDGPALAAWPGTRRADTRSGLFVVDRRDPRSGQRVAIPSVSTDRVAHPSTDTENGSDRRAPRGPSSTDGAATSADRRGGIALPANRSVNPGLPDPVEGVLAQHGDEPGPSLHRLGRRANRSPERGEVASVADTPEIGVGQPTPNQGGGWLHSTCASGAPGRPGRSPGDASRPAPAGSRSPRRLRGHRVPRDRRVGMARWHRGTL